MGLELMDSEASSGSRLEISRNITERNQMIEEILLASRLGARDATFGTVGLARGRFEHGNLAQVVVGSYVEIKGNLAGEVLQPNKVEIKSRSSRD